MRTVFVREPKGNWRKLQIDDSEHFESGREGTIYATPNGELALKLFHESDIA